MATMKKPVAKAQNGTKKKPIRPTFKNLALARSYSNKEFGNPENTPATKKDSTDYKVGFINGVRGKKPSADRIKYGDENEYEKMGRWEGQNALKKKKNGGPVKKAKSGTSLGMKSVKAGFDKNPGVTRADIIVAAKKEAKSGAKLKKQAAVAIAMKKAGKTPKAMMKSGGSMKKCRYGCK